MAKLPGKQVTDNVPALPNIAPAAPARDTAEAVVAWNTIAKMLPTLLEIKKFMDDHPEIIQWAKDSQAGVFRFTPPSK